MVSMAMTHGFEFFLIIQNLPIHAAAWHSRLVRTSDGPQLSQDSVASTLGSKLLGLVGLIRVSCHGLCFIGNQPYRYYLRSGPGLFPQLRLCFLLSISSVGSVGQWGCTMDSLAHNGKWTRRLTAVPVNENGGRDRRLSQHKCNIAN